MLPPFYATAIKEWKPVADEGYVVAQYNLGAMYYNAIGVVQDYKAAVKWYTLASEQGHTMAQTNLGFMYAEGHGVIKNYVYAYMWGNIGYSKVNENGKK